MTRTRHFVYNGVYYTIQRNVHDTLWVFSRTPGRHDDYICCFREEPFLVGGLVSSCAGEWVKFKEGLPHCSDGPAVHTETDSIFFNEGKIHRVDGPAFVRSSSDRRTEKWMIDNVLHRLDGPASICRERNGRTTKVWFRNGLRHRLDGPAVVSNVGHGSEEWYFDGINVTDHVRRYMSKHRLPGYKKWNAAVFVQLKLALG